MEPVRAHPACHQFLACGPSSLYLQKHQPIIIKEKLSRDEVVLQAREEAAAKGFVSAGEVLAVLEGERLTQGGIAQLGAFQIIRVEQGA